MINSSYQAMISEPGYITILPPFHVRSLPWKLGKADHDDFN